MCWMEGFLPSANGGIVVLGDLLVGLLAGTGGSALNGLRDVVGGLLEGIHFEEVFVVMRRRWLVVW